MKTNMTQSGEHDNDSYNFVEAAMKKVIGSHGLTKIGCYYFFERCEVYPEVDENFSDAMETSLMGGTSSPLIDDSSIGMNSYSNTSGKKDTGYVAALAQIFAVFETGIKETNALLSESNKLAERNSKVAEESNRIAEEKRKVAQEKNVIASRSQLIQLAQALGDTEVLAQLFQSLKEQEPNK